ncbi:MAG: glycosyltransferase family 4 protein [Gammaproteobacteria bacterium]|nr:glycosyltransferase family 4 protein [Gammaproteobacteria bacterium]
MHILVVSQYFWPENFRINDLCAELVRRGHEVTVLTGKPNYPDGEVFPDFQSNPHAFNEYEGCRVVRVPMFSRGTGSSVKLLMNYFSYFLSATLIGSWWLRDKHFDVIFVFEPSPITVGLPAVLLKKLKKAPLVFWVLDLWPETLEAIGVVKSKSILGLIGRLVSFIYNRCDLVLGQSKAFHDGISRYCKDQSKIKYFPSWSERIFLGIATSPVQEIDKHEGVFKVLFAGNIGESQDFSAILQAANVLKAKQLKTKIFIVGDGRAFEWVKSEIVKLKLDSYVYLLGRHPLETMTSFYKAADALLVTLQESPVFAMTIPGKVQSYMAAGKPILTMLTGEGSRVIEEAMCGYVAPSGDYNSLANNIVRMSQLSNDERDELGENAKNYSAREFDRDKLITQLEHWFIDVSQAAQAKIL